ncbi:MAG: hypothetical protein C0617_07375 [Desulfuromonas sp.]|uniref:nucleotidyltransferase domain-containing protein n=1 Tax=Desulfuromonas sp. TaxID=892 RepID=UPI000CA6958E|nr:nucleotidyltransferase family protein [Desulfuromonas sp.]PLX84652.1 MAG: hypothetical protein C0617_07375 [Desulfuromonas sp.]
MSRAADWKRVARPELALLFACARTDLGPESAEAVRALLGRQLDWTFLLRAARRHGLQPLLYWHIKEVPPGVVPEEILKRLERHFRGNARRNLFLTGELVRILERFRARGIPAIPFKGPALTEALYGDLALREFCDLDILVPRGRAREAVESLAAEGYLPFAALTPEQHHRCLKFFHHLHLTHPTRGFFVEIHWLFFRSKYTFALDMGRFWATHEARPESAGLNSLPPEEALLYLCAHGTVHAWEELKWVCDVAALLNRHADLDWGKVLALADDLRCRRGLFLGLVLAGALLDAPVPKEVAAKAEGDRRAVALAALVWQNLNADGGRPLSKFAGFAFNLKVKECVADRLRLCAGFAFALTEADLPTLQLPGGLFFLHYLLRPLRLLRELGSGLIGRVRGGRGE